MAEPAAPAETDAPAECEAEDGLDLYYIPAKALEGIKTHLENGKKTEDLQPFVDLIVHSDKVADDEMMIPVDMRGAGKEFESVEEMLEELGPRGTAETFVKCREYWEANKDGEDENHRAPTMTSSEWRDILAENEEMYDEGFECTEEEEGVGDEEVESDDEEADEQAASDKAGEGEQATAAKRAPERADDDAADENEPPTKRQRSAPE